MKSITRREALRRLGGASALAAIAGAMKVVLGGKAAPTESAELNPSTSVGSHHDRPMAHEATSSSQLAPSTEVPAGSASTSPPTAPEPSTATTGADTTAHHTTASTAPLVPVGTMELAGTLSATLVSAGQVATVVGDLELNGDLVVEGILTGVDTFRVEGNGFQIEVRNGGQLDLRGLPKSGWIRGGSASGWQNGDRILSAPVDPDHYGASDFGAGSPGVVQLVDGRSIAAEQFNLTRSIVINNVSRLMFHGGAGRQVLKHVAVTNSGISGKLLFYPIHFHFNGNTTRGSIVEGVVVENGGNHAFVPHASHGITFLDCIAFNTIGDAYWWDPPAVQGDPSNDTHDTVWQHCLAAVVVESPGSSDHRLTAFRLGGGSSNRCLDSTAVAVRGGKNSSGFHWPELGGAVWEFRGCVAHNNESTGIFTWQNGTAVHLVDDFIAYRCGRAGIEHGAYRNNYQYRRIALTDTSLGVIAHALSKDDGSLVFEGVTSNNELLISQHNQPSTAPVVYRSCRFPGAVVRETGEGKGEPGIHDFIDSGLRPEMVELSAIHPRSTIRISEGGTLLWEWAGGGWTQA